MKRKTKAKIKRAIINTISALIFSAITNGVIIYIICNIDKFSTIYK